MASEALTHEREAINSIYGPSTLQSLATSTFTPSTFPPSTLPSSTLPSLLTPSSTLHTLTLPHHGVTLRISFPSEYPDVAPLILGTESTAGARAKMGYGKRVLEVARGVLGEVFREGEVCVFDLVEGMGGGEGEEDGDEERDGDGDEERDGDGDEEREVGGEVEVEGLGHGSRGGVPSWTLSERVTEKKSVFLARACAVSSPAQVQAYISHLLADDKRAAKATHNISAYRIRSVSADANPGAELTFQDCDDDGENAAGGRLLHLLQIMDVWGVLVVVSRWYGGVLLGPDRFRIINAVAREAVVRGGWVKGGGVV